MGNINCRYNDSKKDSFNEIDCNSKSNSKDNQPQIINNQVVTSFEIPFTEILTIPTPTITKGIDISSNQNMSNDITNSMHQQAIKYESPIPMQQIIHQPLQQQPASLPVMTPIRKQSTLKHSEGRKMPLEVIDEINGEIMYINNDIHSPQKTTPSTIQQQHYQYKNTLTKASTSSNISHRKKSWRDMKIISIIPQDKLEHADENDILFQGEFFKFTRENDLKKIDATAKYLILTRSELRIFRSKEIVLHGLSPLQRISLFNISQCDTIKIPQMNNGQKLKNLCKYNFCIEFITVNGMKIDNDNDDKQSISNTSQINNSLIKKNMNDNVLLRSMTVGIDQDRIDLITSKGKRKPKRMKLIEGEEKNSEINGKTNKMFCYNNSELIIFSSDNEDLVNKWIRKQVMYDI